MLQENFPEKLSILHETLLKFSKEVLRNDFKKVPRKTFDLGKKSFPNFYKNSEKKLLKYFQEIIKKIFKMFEINF